MRSSLFPDVNVWVALTHERHALHPAAAKWFRSEPSGAVFFCRFRQLGLLRLLTNEQVMGVDVMSRRAAWGACRRWFEEEQVEFHREPESPEFERLFEELSSGPRPSTKLWADAYLAAFARSAGLILVTFDQALARVAAGRVRLLARASGRRW